MSAQKVLEQAASRIGYYAPDDPLPGSEAGRYMANRLYQPWLAGPSTSVWWCMCFVSMCFELAGEIDAIGGLSYNTDLTLARCSDRLVKPVSAQPGDVVIFNWNGGSTDHVGIVEKNLGNGILQTIEGNTSSGALGSQQAGNGVWRRQRSSAIAAVIRPDWHHKDKAEAVNNIAVDGIPGPKTYSRFQEVMGTPVDGQKSRPSLMIKAFQAFLSNSVPVSVINDFTGSPVLEIDGYDGAKTWRIFQYWVWHARPDIVKNYYNGGFWGWCDGIPGKVTWRVLQHVLNESKTGSGKLL